MAHHGDDEFDDTLLPTDAEIERWRRQYLCSQGEATWEWRAADNIDGILSEPHPHFDLASKAIFRYAHGRTKDAGRYVMYEVPDRMNLDLVWERGISVEYMQRHFLFLPEYLGTVRDRGQGSGVVVIVDMQCSSFLRLSAAFFAGRNMFTEVFAKLNDHYPHTHLLLIINAPFMFSKVWSAISPILAKEIVERTSILGGQDEFLPVLKGILRPEDIPRCYGGVDDTPFGEKDDHVAFREYAYAVTKRNRAPSTSKDSDHRDGSSSGHSGASSNGHNNSSSSSSSNRSGADVDRERTWSSGSSQASGNGSGSNAGSSHGSNRANNSFDLVSSAPSRRRLNSKDPDGFYSYVYGHCNDPSSEAQIAHHGGSGHHHDRGFSSSSSAANSGWNYSRVGINGDSEDESSSIDNSSWSKFSRALYAAQNTTLAVVARFACCVGVLVCYAISLFTGRSRVVRATLLALSGTVLFVGLYGVPSEYTIDSSRLRKLAGSSLLP